MKKTEGLKELLVYARKYKLKIFKKALSFSEERHEGEVRHSGKSYFSHIIDVCFILICFRIRSENMLSAAALHDVVENRKATLQEIEKIFGWKIAELVNVVSKIGGITDGHYFWRISLLLEATVIKVADRLSNMSDMIEVYSLKRLGAYVEETEFFVLPLIEKAISKQDSYRFPLMVFLRIIEKSIATHKKFLEVAKKLKEVMRENRKLKERIRELEER